MKYFWPVLLAVIAVAIAATSVAHATPTPVKAVAKQFYKDNAAAIKSLGGKARLDPNVVCFKTPRHTIYACTFHGTTVAGRGICANYYVAYRPGYHTLPWYQAWPCGSKAAPLPPIPPLSRFRRVQPNTPGA